MIRIILTSAAAMALASANTAAAQINSPTADGYMSRAQAMYAADNFRGCLDQLGQVDTAVLTPAQTEQRDWLMALAQLAVDGAQARQSFVDFLEHYPCSLHRAGAMLRIADCALPGDPAEALRLYSLVDRGRLPLADARSLDYHLAYCNLMLGDYDRATPLFEAVARTRDFGNAARFYLAYISYIQGDYDKAESGFKTVDRAVAPGNMADYYLMQIAFIRSDWKRSLSLAKSLLHRDDVDAPYIAEANRIAGESLYLTGDTRAAIPYLRRYASMTGEPLPSTLYILGVSQYGEGQYRDAVASLQSVSALDNAMAQSASLFIGQALMKLGDKDAALLAFDKALRADHDKDVQEAAYYNYAVAKFGGANIPFGSSVATFEAFLDRYPSSRYAPEVQEYLVDGYMTDGNYDLALASINRMTAPTQKVLAAKQRVLYNLGAAALASGNAATAATYLREARTLSRFDKAVDREARLLLGEALYRTGDFDGSVNELTAYIAAAPKDCANLPLAYYDLGYSEFASRHYPQAAAAMSKVVASPGTLSAPVVADAYNRLADASYYTSDFTAAARHYRSAYDTNPAAGDYPLFQLAVMKGIMRDHKGKIDDLLRLPVEFPSSTLLADALLEMTASFIQLGDNDSAIATFRSLIGRYPGTAQARQGQLQLAQTLLNAGRRDEAIAEWRSIVTQYPTSDESAEAADRLKRIAAEDGTLDQYIAFVNSIADAPRIDVSEVERLSFEAAEKAYLTAGRTEKLRGYLVSYGNEGAYRSRTLALLLEAATQTGDNAAALEAARAIVSDYPDNSAGEAALAIVATDLYDSGHTERALEAWRTLEGKASSPRYLNAARTGIMRAARDLGDYTAVESAADALIASSTLGAEDKTEAVFSKALACSQDGRTDQARTLWESVASMTDDLYGVKSALFLAQDYFDSGDIDEAGRRAEQLTSSGTPHAYWLARGFILMSDVFSRQGKEFEAREYLNALKENYPGNESDIFMMIESRLNKASK